LIPGVDANVAQAAISARAGPDGVDGTGDDVPFRSPGELINAGLSTEAARQLSGRLVGVRSGTFEVIVDAELYGVRKRFYGVIRQAAGNVQLLRFYWD
jgi:hypothetical protein